MAGEAIFEIGRRLKHVKENDLVHGEWERWLETVKIDRAQATRFITVYDTFGKSNDDTYHQMGVQALYLIATMPEEKRNQPHTIPSTNETKTMDGMTVRELRELKKKFKEEEEAKASRVIQNSYQTKMSNSKTCKDITELIGETENQTAISAVQILNFGYCLSNCP
ncbi:DUF3102 domain-containing protein [Sporosarcina saromensis]|uniref:DUF3102 domain-containing protein n=1 Tax=Sporosarcina saromensis TaxID=359365 RepID=A0ABU4G5D9_9BACL|nr:DUF3102 domain-containing protein [Sporosarcina saromensis]MDW0112182.1 DUF3102 domain-containing protein [Sporosarcina saromensis]